MVTMLCTVRGCGLPLERAESALSCGRGHAFDLAREGYVNLLQPQDRRSRQPGDSREVVASRRALLDAGHEAPFVEALCVTVAAAGLPAGAAALDLGCGEGTHLAAIVTAASVEGHGLDISVPAIRAAAKRHPTLRWVVGNADRGLPFAPRSFALVTRLTSRSNAEELRRVVAPGGVVIVAVAGDDDMVELREAVLGEGLRRDRLQRVTADLAGAFELVERRTVRWTARLSGDEARDALAATYRGARAAQRDRAQALGDTSVTLSRELATYR
jgi:23S rRNA (guanine745-N1)-methyltransferase